MHTKKKFKQKLLASILTLAMVLGMMPMMTMEVEASGTTVTTWDGLQTAMTAGGEIVLGGDITAGNDDSALEVPASATVTLDLAGHTIDRKLYNLKYEGNVITVNGDLTINDTSNPSTGTITGGFNSHSNGGGIVVNGTLTMNGGSITGNKVSGHSYGGGGVYVADSSTFTMTGGSITKNNTQDSADAGGVYIAGTFNFFGGSITENTAHFETSGIAFKNYSNYNLNLQGDVNVSGNPYSTFGPNGPVNLDSDIRVWSQNIGKIKITGALDENAKIHLLPSISDGEAPLEITGADGVLAKDFIDNFIIEDSAKSEYSIGTKDGSYSIWIEKIKAVTFDANGGEFSADATTSDVTVADDMTIPANPTWNNFHFAGWYADTTFTDEVTLEEMKALSSSTTVYAKWTNNGKIVRTTPIEIDANTATTDKLEAEGWKWDKTTKTLTLDGLTMDVFDISEDAFAISVSITNAATNVILADGSSNSVTSSARGISGTHTTTFKGEGSLTTNTVGMGIAGTMITIDRGTYNLTSGHQTISLHTLTVNNGTINVATTGQQSAIFAGSQFIIKGGEVTATAPTGKAAIYPSVSTSEGTPTIKAGTDKDNATDTTYTDQSYVNISFIPTVTFDPNNGTAIGSPVEIASGMTILTPTWDYTFDGWYKEKEFTTKLTNDEIKALDTSTTLYAKWTNTDGKAVVTKPIVIDENTGDIDKLSAEGWKWDATSKTLTLDGLTLDFYSGSIGDHAIDIELAQNDDVIVNLEKDSSNHVISDFGGIKIIPSATTFQGEGSLEVNAVTTGIGGVNITFDGGNYNITSTRVEEAVAINANNLTVNDGTINAKIPKATDSDWNSAIFYSGDFYLNGGEVTATAPTGIYAVATYDDQNYLTYGEIKTTAALTIKAGADASSATDTAYTGQPYVYAKAQGVAVSSTTVEGRVGDDLGDLTAKAVGLDGVVSYQWHSNTNASNAGGTAISGANSATYPLPTDLAEGTYYYYVTATSSEGEFTSAVTTVTVKPLMTDAEAVAEAKRLIEANANYDFTQATANNEEDAKHEIVRKLNALTGMKEIGIVFDVGDITFTAFSEANNGTAGSATFSVTVERGTVTGEKVEGETATITATPVQATISGKIVDKDGTTAVVGAEVTITVNGSTTASAITDASGEYTISDVPNGIYTVTVTKDGKTQTSSVTVTSGTIDEIVFVTEGNKNTTITVETTEGTPPTTADNLESMFDGTEEGSEDVEIELRVAKTDAPADKDEVDFAIVGQNVLGMYLDIELIKATTSAGIGSQENIQPPDGETVTITIQLPAEHRNKAPYQIIHVHNGVTEIITPIYNEDFHTLTFEASKFSTYAYTYTDTSIVIHTLTVEGVDTSTGGSANGKYASKDVFNINAGTKSGYTFVNWTSDNDGTFANANSASTIFTMPDNDVTITANWREDSGSSGGGSSTPTYRPDRNEPDNGDYTVTPSAPKKGNKVTIKPDPNDGYIVDEVMVKDKNGDDVEVKDNGDGTYTFTQPSGKVSITVTFKEDMTSLQMGVKLDKENHIAYMSGVGENMFAPDKNITRAEVIMMFSRIMAEKMDDTMTYTSTFTDITGDEWCANAIGYMEQFDIVTGYEDGTFKANQPITRAEFATIASRFENFVESDTNNFSDVADDYWATPYINSASAQDFVNGYPDGTFKPTQNITRAEAVTIVNNMLGRTADKTFIEDNMEDIMTFVDVNSYHWAYYQILEAANGHEHTKSEDKEIWTKLK